MDRRGGPGTSGEVTGRSRWTWQGESCDRRVSLLTSFQFPDLKAHLEEYHRVKKQQTESTFSEYLVMKRVKKKMRMTARYHTKIQPTLYPPVLETLIPDDRTVADQLVDLYFSTFETTFRILHVPQFLEEYNDHWHPDNHGPMSTGCGDIFAAKLLSLMACATCLVDTAVSGEDSQSLNEKAKSWIGAVVSWVKTLTSRARLTLDVIQVKCLLLLARQAVGHEGDLAWLAAGSLVREAITIGLHRDPSHFKGLSPYWGEIRRRLWLTIIELDLQAALETGAPVTLSEDEYDCAPPSNIDDEDLLMDSPVAPTPKPITVLTRTTFQVSLAQTMGVRINIAKAVNRVRLTLSYQRILDLSEMLTTQLAKGHPALIGDDSCEADSRRYRLAFRQSLFLFLIYRCLLALHRPFFLSLAETRNETYSFSRQMCVQASLALLAPLEISADDLDRGPDNEQGTVYPYLLRLRGGMFRDEFFHAAATLCFELRLQAKDKPLLPLPGSVQGFMDKTTSYQRIALFRNVENAIRYFELKVRKEKQACKAFMLLHMVFNSAQSQMPSSDPEHRASSGTHSESFDLNDACPRAARRCRELLLADGGLLYLQEAEEWLSSSGGFPSINQEDPDQHQTSSRTTRTRSMVTTEEASHDAPTTESIPDLADELPFDWDIFLDPMAIYPTGEVWPAVDPLL
ncbi:hypothetical protein AARAC_000502 [Aspergillus arachidicola]|uniref:Xylanolytic transcriptional activator regulatory domain-containing protein n=1 Tax=Aspergillus arachidicola TaxID=656916 RepID=A0A2G7G7D9_9EURO|nr:hypothetical protein AARAC_000502 [Aspergillus arachidicola]